MTKDEYEKRFAENQVIEGYGLETTVHLPCPFCAAPDFIIHKVVEAEEAYLKGGVCTECGRGAKIEFSVNTPSNKQFEFVQTCGDDPPDYLPPMRRVASS